MPQTEVLFYQEDDEQRTVPLLNWLERQSAKVQAKCQAYLKQLEDFGHELRRPVADILRDGIYELRPTCQGVHYRLLYFFPKPPKGRGAQFPKVAVVSHGIAKEGEVPEVEIDRAGERKGKFEADPTRHTFRPRPRR